MFLLFTFHVSRITLFRVPHGGFRVSAKLQSSVFGLSATLLDESLAISSELGMRPLMERVLSRQDGL